MEEAREWGWRLGIDSGELAEILRKGEGFTNEEKVKIQDFAALYGIRILEHAGLDVVYDGEQRRSEMYDHVVKHTKGFETRGTVRSFDNKYYTKAAVVEKPLVEGLRSRRVRVRPVAHGSRRQGPVHWRLHHHGLVYDEHYAKDTMLGGAAQRAEARRRFGVDVARDVVRPEPSQGSSRLARSGSRSTNPQQRPARRRCRSSSRPSTQRARA